MLKAKLIMLAVRIVMALIALGVGIWYLSSSLGGAELTYTSMDNFLTAAGVQDGDIASANGCFMCGYIADLFAVIGNAASRFWTLMVDHIWILMALGVGVYIFIYTGQYLFDIAKKTSDLKPNEVKIEFKGWFDKVWKLGLRVLIVGALMGALGMGGTTALKTVSKITITPVLFVGSELSMLATGVADAAQCGALETTDNSPVDDASDILNPILQPFMCVIGNINAVMLAGAAGGFSLMNYSWLGLGGGVFTWLAGLALVIMFLIIGFDLFFQILTVVFKLVFLIIFLPLLLAATAFEQVWAKAKSFMSASVGMLVSSAVRIVAITLKVLVIFGMVSFCADEFYPGPNDGYTAILPPMMGIRPENPDAQTLSVMNVFSECESVALSDGEMDKDKFKDCFVARRAQVERTYPGAFNFLGNGFDFLLMMLCLFFLYYYAVSPKIDKLFPKGNIKLPMNPGEKDLVTPGETFDYGAWVHDVGRAVWAIPEKITKKVTDAMQKKDG